MVQEPIEDSASDGAITVEDSGPLFEGFVGSNGDGATLVALGPSLLGLKDLFSRAKPLASMKPSLSRPAAKILFFLFLIHFGRRLATTHLLGFGV